MTSPNLPVDPALPNESAADKYERMMLLAGGFDSAGEQLRAWAAVGAEILADEDVAASEDLSVASFREAEELILSATSGRGGLLDRSIELDADALIVRATVMTYRWIDDLQVVAERTLGAVASRAISYLAPEIALGGAIVSAGLIETDALDREGLASYLNDLAEANPELMDHFASGGGGLLDRLQMRALLTVGVLGGPNGGPVASGGMRAIGADEFRVDSLDALRDIAGSFAEDAAAVTAVTGSAAAPGSVTALMQTLTDADTVRIDQISDGRYIAYLPGRRAATGLEMVATDRSGDVAAAAAAITDATTPGAQVMLVGGGFGGAIAAELASAVDLPWVVAQVITVDSPAAHSPVVPEAIQVLSLEDRADPVALLGSLISATPRNRLTVVYDAGETGARDSYVVGGRAVDAAENPDLKAALARIQGLGYLAG